MAAVRSDLHRPLTLACGRTLAGRIALAPLTNLQSNSDGTLGDDEYHWLEPRAGSFPLVSTCATYVSEQGHAWDGQLGIAEDRHVPGLQRLAHMVHDAGSSVIVQLHHGGALANVSEDRISASAGEGVREATEADLAGVVDSYVAAAQRAIIAGFDGVEVHGANGYLFTQFLAPASNERTDRWGGDIVGRARLLVEVTRAVRDAIGPDALLSVRISPVDTWDQRGLVLADGVALARMLGELGIDILHLSLAQAAAPPPHETTDVPVARAIRDALPASVRLAVAGGIATLADAEAAVAAGSDIVVLGRTAIAHPNWPAAVRRSDFVPHPRPYSEAYLRSVGVSQRFFAYLKRFAGLVEGGAPPRE